MEQSILELLTSQGVFAILFSYLLFYILKENNRREENYQQIIKDLSETLPEIQDNIKEINAKLK